MSEKTIKISKKIVIKIFVLFMFLLTVTFLLGLYLGRGAISGKLTYSVEEECKENLNACSFRIQELSLKYQEIVKMAREKGIIDKKNRSVQNIVCEKREKSDESEEKKLSEPISEKNKKTAFSANEKAGGNLSDKKNLKKEKKVKKAGVKTPEKKQKNKPEKQIEEQKKRQKARSDKKKPSVKKNVWEEIDTLKEKGKSECRYALQLFSGTSRNQAKAARKNIPVKNTRIVEGNVDGNIWYRIRYGCFSTKSEAEKKLLSISAKVRNPIIVEVDRDGF